MSELSPSVLSVLVADLLDKIFFWEIFKRDISTNTKLIPILLVPSVPVEGKEEFSNPWMGSGSDPAVPANKLLNGSALHLS